MQTNHLSSRILGTNPVKWRALCFIQQDEFKDLSHEAHSKLKASILTNNFTQPFYVWQEPGTSNIYCLDGKHRTIILEELSAEGHDIPEELPATFIDCKDKQEAAKLVLVYSSIYAKVTSQGLFDFIKEYELDYGAIKDVIDIPDFSVDRYEQKFDIYQVRDDQDEYEVDDLPDEEILVKPGDLFQLGSHRVLCATFLEPLNQVRLMREEKARIMITDPPYNLPANLYTNINGHAHDNFAMAAGEMSDEEFVRFLADVMRSAVNHTIDGGIHFIFMDWRHMWHMTEAGRKVYGSVTPKQLCVWNKDMMANGSFYRSRQELCFVFNSPGAKYLWHKDMLDQGGFYKDNDELVFVFKNGESKHLSHLDLADRIRTNVWNYPSAKSHKNPDRYQLKNHPTPKPVAMIADAILDTTNPGDIVIDWFLGSGTAIIAGEKTGRRVYGAEIEPKFVQTIVKRYLLYCEKNGREPIFTHVNGNLTLNHFQSCLTTKT
jgi:DNA modification methylase